MYRPLWRATVLLVLSLVVMTGSVTAAEKIVWWHWASGDAEREFLQAAAEFTQATGIEVEAQQVAWADLKTKLLVGIAGGVAPDVTAVTSTWFEELALQGAFENLDPYIKRDNQTFWRGIFPTSMQLWQTENGAQYAVPFDNDIPVLFYNKSLFDSVGIAYPNETTRWDDWLNIATKQTRDIDGDGKKDYYGMTNWWFTWYMLVWANGGEFFTADKRPNLNDPAVRQAFEYYAQWFAPQRGVLAQGNELEHHGEKQVYMAWKNGRIAMAPAGAWMPSYWVFDSAAGKYNFDFDCAPMPLSYAGKRATTNEGQGNAVLATSKKKDAAYLFAKFLADTRTQQAAGKLGQFPVRRSVALQDDLFLAKDKWPANRNVVIGAAEYSRPFPRGVNWVVTSVEIAKMRDYFNGKLPLDATIANVSSLLEAKLRELKIIK